VELGDYRLQVIRIHLDRSMLVNQLKRQDKPKAIAPPNESSLETLHYAAPYAYTFTDDKIAERFDVIPAST
jgi:hypothetical protein